MKQIYLARDSADADIVCAILRAAGIDAYVKNESAPVVDTPFPSVWVEPDDEARAREILDAEMSGRIEEE